MTISVKQYAYALYLAARDPRVPKKTKVVIAFFAAYLLSPVDLIPDFIPVLGYLDDVLLLGLMIWLAAQITRRTVWEDSMRTAQRSTPEPPRNRRPAAVIIGVWILTGSAVAAWLGLPSA